MLHSKENQSLLLDQMSDEATEILFNKAEPFKAETDECFIATQSEIDAMVFLHQKQFFESWELL